MRHRQLPQQLGGLLMAYLLLALGTLLIWRARGVYLLVGDEPHYLVIARALADSLSLDQLQAYQAELARPVIFAQTMEPLDPTLSSPGTQTFINPSGMFSVHAPGLGMLLAPAFFLGGVLGAKVALVLIGALAIPVAWAAVGAFTDRPSLRVAITAVTALGCPLLYSAGQVYPDVPAGVIVLLGLTFLLIGDRGRPPWQHAVVAASLVFLPWLQVKFAAPAIVLMVALAWQWRRAHRVLAGGSLAALAVSLSLLAAFNTHAYGSVTGAYVDGGLTVSTTALMVLFGLFVDQNQGLLMLNPALWAALPGVVVLLRRDRAFALIWLVVIASLVVPNAMHPNWFGGGSFIGRFALPASMACIIPAAAGLTALYRRAPRALWTVVAAAALIQALFWAWYALISGIEPGFSSGVDLYNKPAGTWLESYAVFAFPIERFLPALYDIDWAWSFGPNLVWIGLAGLLIVLSWLSTMRSQRLTGSRGRAIAIGMTCAVAVAVVSGLLTAPGPRSIARPAADLASQTGSVQGLTRVAEFGSDGPAFITVGPQVSMRQGPYAISVRYRSSAPPDATVGRLELADAATNTVLRAVEVPGTLNRATQLVDTFAYRSLTPQVLEVRVAWYGTGTLAVETVGVRHADGP